MKRRNTPRGEVVTEFDRARSWSCEVGGIAASGQPLEEQLLSFSGHVLAGRDLTEAAGNLAKFMELLARIDTQLREQGDDDASDGSEYCIRQAEGRAHRLRKRRHR